MRENRPSGLMQGRKLFAVYAAAYSCLLYLVLPPCPLIERSSLCGEKIQIL